MAINNDLQTRIRARSIALESFRADPRGVAGAIVAITERLRDGGRILTCGNGGSAAEAQHLAEELVGRFKRERRPLGAVCLAADSTALTCIANDYGFDEVFARQVRGIGRAGDVLVALSTSGTSPNVIRALEAARSIDMKTVGLLGRPGSPAETLCDVAVTPDVEDAAIVQEIHLMTIHLILESLDATFGDSSNQH